MPIVLADPERHAQFIFGTWCSSAGEPRETLNRLLRRRLAKAVVLEGLKPGSDGKPKFSGWASVLVADPQQVVWAYTKSDLRDMGTMVECLTALGTDTTAEMTALFPSPVVETLRYRGWRIRYPEKSSSHGQDPREARAR